MHKIWGHSAIVVVSAGIAVCVPSQILGQALNLDVVVNPAPPIDAVVGYSGVGPAIDFFDKYSWQTFIALNWPAENGKRGEPDGSKAPAVALRDRTSPRVWETWKSVEETFPQANNETPAAWPTAETLKLCNNATSLGTPSEPVKILADLNQADDQGAGIAPLIAQNGTYVRYEIRMNKVQFDHIVGKKLYLRENLARLGETAAERRKKAVLFPPSTIDVKAAWKELKAGDVASRYYVRDAFAMDPVTGDCEKRQFGMIGFHIAQRTPSRKQWIWSTFEHVDNVTLGKGIPPGTKLSLRNTTKSSALGQRPLAISKANPPIANPVPVQVVAATPQNEIPDETAKTNAKWHGDPLISASVWSFYELVETQWPEDPNNDPKGKPTPSDRVANLTMETYLQGNSCINCHFNASNDRLTDFVWFLGLRAFPITSTPSSNAKILNDHFKSSP